MFVKIKLLPSLRALYAHACLRSLNILQARKGLKVPNKGRSPSRPGRRAGGSYVVAVAAVAAAAVAVAEASAAAAVVVVVVVLWLVVFGRI